ncbi:hypothetical protein GGR40_003994 [Novosphingobium gossypii]
MWGEGGVRRGGPLRAGGPSPAAPCAVRLAGSRPRRMGLQRPAVAVRLRRPGSPVWRHRRGCPHGARAASGAAVPCWLAGRRPLRLARSAWPGHGLAGWACIGPPSRPGCIAPARLRRVIGEGARVGRGQCPARRSLACWRAFARCALRGPPGRVTASPDGLAAARLRGPAASPRLACVASSERMPAWGEGGVRRGGPLLAGGPSPAALCAVRLAGSRHRRVGLQRPADAVRLRRPGSPVWRHRRGCPHGARAASGAAVPCLLAGLRPLRFARSAWPGHGIALARLPTWSSDAFREEGERGSWTFGRRETC